MIKTGQRHFLEYRWFLYTLVSIGEKEEERRKWNAAGVVSSSSNSTRRLVTRVAAPPSMKTFHHLIEIMLCMWLHLSLSLDIPFELVFPHSQQLKSYTFVLFVFIMRLYDASSLKYKRKRTCDLVER